MNILEVDANHDTATKYGYEFRVKKYVYPKFHAKGLNVTHLRANMARTRNFKLECNKPDIDFITGFGHGNPELYTGQNSPTDVEILWKTNSFNPREVSGRIVHLLSCSTAKRLGIDIVSKGASAYFGYYDDFIAAHTKEPPEDLTKDTNADPFFKCDSEIDRLLVDGMKAEDVYRETLKRYDEQIEKFLEINHRIVSYLLNDKYSLCLYGNPDTRLEE